jgi:hypothetical protein
MNTNRNGTPSGPPLDALVKMINKNAGSIDRKQFFVRASYQFSMSTFPLTTQTMRLPSVISVAR